MITQSLMLIFSYVGLLLEVERRDSEVVPDLSLVQLASTIDELFLLLDDWVSVLSEVSMSTINMQYKFIGHIYIKLRYNRLSFIFL